MSKRIHVVFPWRRRHITQTAERPSHTERASGEEAVLTREQRDAEATPSDMTRLKTDRL